MPVKELARDGDTGMIYHRKCGLNMVASPTYNADWATFLSRHYNNEDYWDWLPEQ